MLVDSSVRIKTGKIYQDFPRFWYLRRNLFYGLLPMPSHIFLYAAQ